MIEKIPGLMEYDSEKICNISAVYFLCVNDIPIYIGATINLKRRIKDHQWQRFVFEKAYYLPTLPDLLLKIEKVYIKYFEPKYNLVHTPNSQRVYFPIKKRCYNYEYFREIVARNHRKLSDIFFEETVAYWIEGIQNPMFSSIVKVCTALGIDWRSIVEEIPYGEKKCHI